MNDHKTNAESRYEPQITTRTVLTLQFELVQLVQLMKLSKLRDSLFEARAKKK